MVVEGIQVNGMSCDGSLLTLPKLYARREIPIDQEETATPAKIKEWKHLKSISNEIVQKDDVQVDLLIGADRMQTLVKAVVHMPIKLGWIGVLLDQ